MIDLNIGIQPGVAQDGIMILAKYSDTDRIAYILRAEFGASTMEIQDSNDTPVAHITERLHQIRKSDWRINFEDNQPAVLFKPQSYFSSKWTAEFDGKMWEMSSGSEHKVTSGSTAIGLVKTSYNSVGASRVAAIDEKDLLVLVGFAGALYLRDLKRSSIGGAPIGLSGIAVANC